MKIVSILGVAALLLSACMPRNDGAVQKPADMHTSQNSLDWAGVYEGVQPCADCPGIKTRLTLHRDGSFELSTQYLERPVAAQIVRGQFTWNAAGNAITLDAKGGGQRFAVGEGRLSMLGGDGSTVLPPAPYRTLTLVPTAAPIAAPTAPGLMLTLGAHHWTLDSATDGQGRRIEAVSSGPGRAFVFSFGDGRLHIQGGCNQLTGSYQINADGLLTVGRMAATMMACEAALMQADSALSALLAQPLQIDLSPGAPPRMRLVSASHETLVFTGQATPEALYGPATRIFMEVAAQRIACQNPLNGDTLCLQVRERQYDAEGLVVGVPGAWRPLYENIDGYQHTAGVRNVLRLKRFDRGAALPGGASAVYVLDLVVESETVAR